MEEVTEETTIQSEDTPQRKIPFWRNPKTLIVIVLGVVIATALSIGICFYLKGSPLSLLPPLPHPTPTPESDTKQRSQASQPSEEEAFTNLITDDNFVRSVDLVGKAVEEYLTAQNMFQEIRAEPLEIQGHSYSLSEVINRVSIGSKRWHEINSRVVIALIRIKEERDGPNAVNGEWIIALGDTLSRGYTERAFREARTIRLASGESINVPDYINAGTFAVYSALANEASSYSDWKQLIGRGEGFFFSTYSALFGSPLKEETE